jgi:hypothetical protein
LSSSAYSSMAAYGPFLGDGGDNETLMLRSQQLRPAKKLRRSMQNQDQDGPSDS